MSGHPHNQVEALKVAISASISLAFMIVDFGCLVRDEVKYIWPRFRASWTSRIYMLTRYMGAASQIFNVYFTVRMYLGVYTSPAGCRLWFIYQAFVVQLLLAFVEGMLMRRIYALFIRNQLVLLILISFALGQMASMVVSARLSFPSNKHTVTCLSVGSNPGNAFFRYGLPPDRRASVLFTHPRGCSATTMTTNLLIFFMTFWRYLRLPASWTQQGVGWVVFRDSAWSLSAISGGCVFFLYWPPVVGFVVWSDADIDWSVVMMFLTLCSLDVIKPSMSGNTTYYWLVCILWISIGRIVVNHEKIPRDEGGEREGNTWSGTLQLTSQIEMGEITLTQDTQHGSSIGGTPRSTLKDSLPTPMTKASQLSPSDCTSDDARKWLGDPPLPPGSVRGRSPQPSNTSLPVDASVPKPNQLSPSSVFTREDDASRTVDHPQADADAHEHGHSPSPSPQPSSSKQPPSEVSS
ncbi:hypothetical protein J3R83DRAFT_8037 [Lanmaoa asiatica]|nr:hypothetical protein J3R83DRAFT_8037 [Lanmaoa asiatica]